MLNDLFSETYIFKRGRDDKKKKVSMTNVMRGVTNYFSKKYKKNFNKESLQLYKLSLVVSSLVDDYDNVRINPRSILRTLVNMFL